MSDDERAVVIGGGGFIGSALVSWFRAAGRAVESFTRDVPFMSSPGVLTAPVAAATTVYWLASSVNPAVAEQRPDLVRADQAAFEELLGAAKALAQPPRVVLLSSGGTVYDAAAEPPYREDAPTAPTTAYGRSKLALERTLLESPLPDAAKVVVRVSNAYGPGQPARRGQAVIAHWLQAAAQRQPLALLGDPGTVRDFVYIDDIVDALARIDGHGRDLPPVLNVGSGRPTTLQELADVVLAVVGDPAVRLDVRPPRSFDLSQTWLDVERARRALGWHPSTALPDGVAAAWAAVRVTPGG